MSLFSIFMIGIGLSMDAFAVSIARGMTMKKEDLLRYALTLGFFFGVFQAVMPLIGWWAGSYFRSSSLPSTTGLHLVCWPSSEGT